MRRLSAIFVGSAFLFSCENDPKTIEKVHNAVTETQNLGLELMLMESGRRSGVILGIIIE